MAATMRLALAFLSSSLFALTYGETIGPVTDLHIVNKIIAPDGFNRSTVLAGGKADTAAMPGPLIVGDKDSHFRINLVNSLEDRSMLTTTAIHWHGLFQAGTSWADGPVGVNQCPIVPGNSFLYQFDAAGQAGTFWYHSHHSTQYCDGLRGPLVIYDPQDPHKSKYDIDDESTVITLADWYHLPAPAGARFPQPNSTLINGLGRFIGGPNTPLAVMNVKPKKRYRMRLVNIACFPNFNFSIDNHNMTIIEADGVSTNPLTVDSIQIFVAQRYSFVLTADQPVNNYWIRSLPNLPPLAGAGFANGVNSAILRYAGAPNTDPTTSQTPSVIPLLESNLSPLTDPQAPGKPVPGGADINLNLNITFDPAVQRYSVNGASFETPPLPVLLQILSGARTPQELLPAGSVFVFPPGKSVEVSIPGGAPGGPHPFHLHGQVFDVVRSAGSTTYNFANPVKRDVVSIGVGGDNVTFRFSTDNPGPWFLHCHIDWHLEVGLAVVFVTDSDATAQTFTPQAWNDLCPAYNASGLP